MRKRLLIGFATVAVSCVGAYVFFAQTATKPPVVTLVDGNKVAQRTKDDGNAEASEVIEPLIVEGGNWRLLVNEPANPLAPLVRATWNSNVSQPARPDAEPDKVLRMPYADEDEILGVPVDPIRRIFDASMLPWLDIFDGLDPEEAEPKEITPPAMNLYPPHHSHCPHAGGCPAPYPYRR